MRKIKRIRENWKAFNEDYLISNKGRWYSLKEQKILKQYPNNAGYMRAQICTNGARKWYFTHITVVNLFGDCYGNRLSDFKDIDDCMTIDHLDFDKTNNSIFNLQIVTHSENIRRAQEYYRNKIAMSDLLLDEIF